MPPGHHAAGPCHLGIIPLVRAIQAPLLQNGTWASDWSCHQVIPHLLLILYYYFSIIIRSIVEIDLIGLIDWLD